MKTLKQFLKESAMEMWKKKGDAGWVSELTCTGTLSIVPLKGAKKSENKWVASTEKSESESQPVVGLISFVNNTGWSTVDSLMMLILDFLKQNLKDVDCLYVDIPEFASEDLSPYSQKLAELDFLVTTNAEDEHTSAVAIRKSKNAVESTPEDIRDEEIGSKEELFQQLTSIPKFDADTASIKTKSIKEAVGQEDELEDKIEQAFFAHKEREKSSLDLINKFLQELIDDSDHHVAFERETYVEFSGDNTIGVYSTRTDDEYDDEYDEYDDDIDDPLLFDIEYEVVRNTLSFVCDGKQFINLGDALEHGLESVDWSDHE